jgi:hypothetical protein
MSSDFRTLLQKPMDEIERPKPLPAGTYYGTIAGHKFDESSQKRTPFVRFTIKLQSAGDDVDAEEVASVDWTKKEVRKDFYLTDDALYRLKGFLESVGVEVEGRALGEAIPDSTNAQVIVEVTQRNSADGKDVYNDVGDVRGAD